MRSAISSLVGVVVGVGGRAFAVRHGDAVEGVDGGNSIWLLRATTLLV
ncbi:hypothetical protein [Nonomuraea jiangxiensis]|uniref:Uncharacterized protein n=1 Tax=Nonomuraea jiangxiensis TaxID=633440 RepID=A0A1G8LTV6_9ACTN|nr:hypothetical protein [Nonomuraea jiangxiensis]SDI59152.1 hypothetical protein SAMN05421869_106205 [Nonomuraea jiangxiensis]